MYLLLWLAFGAAIGWLVGRGTRSDAARSTVGTTVTGAVGALLAACFIAPRLGNEAVNYPGGFSFPSMLVSLAGAILLLVVVDLLPRRSTR
jgi:uncharacterized membrane protein YeaQ/YmgE (transglycosylase-associated protein family)